MKKATSFIILAVLLFTFDNSFGQESTYQFLKLDMSARAASLAGSFVSNNDDPDVIFYNPAGLELLEKNPVSFSFVKHLLDINLASLSYSTVISNVGRFGGAIQYINYGTFTQADEFGNKTGEYGAGEFALTLGYANLLDNNFAYGVNVKLIYSKIADRSSSAAAFDVGLHYSIPSNLTDIGFSILNVGTQMSTYYSTKEDLPLDIVFGVSKRMEHVPLRLSLDFHNLNEQQDNFFQKFKSFSVGAEFYLSRVLSLRFGYNNQMRNDLTIGQSAGLAGFDVGLGANVSNYRFDYGFSSLGMIGAIHRISVSTNL
ncbi:MAG: type IX secretion system protein PorQ [Bacteroidetes bacterium]|nr:type IX secretion system protein PorQ [Bacteroidota bacterium]